MKQFIAQRWFLMALATVLAVGTLFHTPLEWMASLPSLRYAIVATVLFLMALPVEARAMWNAARQPLAPLLAVTLNIGVLPLSAWAISSGLQQGVLSTDMAQGILVAATTPCTLASAAVWTRRAGGNDSVAIMVTLVTNASCFLVTPAWLTLMTGKLPNITPGAMVRDLALVVVLPMAIAQIVRLYKPLALAATRHKIPLGVWAQLGILTMVLIGSIRTGMRLGNRETQPYLLEAIVMVVAVVALHLGILAAGLLLGKLLRLPRPDTIAVGFAGSQKTLMVGLQVGLELGITVLPMVVYHVSQLLLDTIIADRLRRRK